uniref:protein broad-minded-like n=1 Tax=Styela clava TaxID=7725 RepID=UPI0019397443|nr:protein broad-minded-like [Styela clava]
MDSDPEEVLSHLHQLVKNVEPIIKESDSVEAAEDAILHLEETDENFHKYDFVRHIHNQLESAMGHLIDEEIEKNSMGGSSMNATSGQETLVQLVTNSVADSKGFSSIVKKLCSETMAASETIIQSIEDERLSAIGEEDSNSQPSRRHQSVFSDGGSTYDHDGLYFLSQKQFHLIADEMDSQKPLNVRREALRRLCQVPPSDVMASESWSQLRISLMAALADNDTHIAHDALSFHAKMFAVSNHQIMKETYTCLAEHLQTLFTSSRHDHLPMIVDGLDLTQPEVVHILKRIRLLNEFQQQVPSIWVRYPENFLEAIVESTLSIIVLHPKPVRGGAKELISPLHFFSLVDTKANWLKKWLHGNYSRYVVIKQMQQDFRVFLQDAVEHCISFCDKCRIKQSNSGMTNLMKKMKQHKIAEEKRRTKYSPAELEHLTFIHSLCVLGRLLLYSQGRDLFPVRTRQGKEVSIQTLVITWIQILNLAKHKPKYDQKSYEPALLAGKILRTLFSSSAFVENCLNTEIIDALLSPVKSWLHEGISNQDSENQASEATMLHISEILACLTSTVSGRNKLMYGCSDKTIGSRKFSAAAHVVAEFAQKALCGNLPSLSKRTQSYLVTGSFVFVCRQMYNTCEGLALLQEYRLHECLARAWKQIHDKHGEVSTPTGSEDGNDYHGNNDITDISPSQSISHNMLLWEENLIDNLLNYAATPKGLLLLQQTGAINECVSYMYTRYRKKLQVSKCEKFGYGVMVTQVAATAPGIVALQLAGFEKALVHELWAGLECASDEIRMTAPPPHPISPIDKSVHKCFIGLVNILSSYDAVFHIFHHQTLPNKPSYSFREVPDSVLKVFDRLVMINSEAKVHSLFNHEQSHVFGLRLLNVLVCSLDTWLLLETQYNIQQTLLQMQKDDCTYEGNIIIDALSVDRNHILVRTQAIGGPSERRIPPRSLEPMIHKGSKQLAYPWPLFNKFPLPKEYTPTLSGKSSVKKESVVSRFLSKTKASDKNRGWLEQCRDMFVKTMISGPGVLKGSILADLLDKAVVAQERMPEERLFPNPSIKDPPLKDSLSPVSTAGIKMAVRYGKHLNLMKSSTEATTNNLNYVLRHCQTMLEDQQEKASGGGKNNNVQIKTLQGPYHGFDWFVSTIFLMNGGNKDKTWNFLQKFSDLLCSGFLWPARLHASLHLPKEMRSSGIHPLFSHTGHHVELILQNELPLVHSTFRMCGYTPSQICQHWLQQCFWNYMDWNQINHYIAVVIILGTDYQVYICISIFKHLQEQILEHRLTQDLQVFLKENPFHGYNVASYMDYMQMLESKYKGMVLSDLRGIAGKSGK